MPRKRKNPTPPRPFVFDLLENLARDPNINESFRKMVSGIGREYGIDKLFTEPVQATIPPEMMRKLLFLCHPDKHQNSPQSTEVTWANEARTFLFKL
jgi:hypothetical protein